MPPTLPRRPRLGVDFHTFDELYQGSRSHLLGLYQAAIRQAPEIDFVFFLDDVAGLRRQHPAFTAPNAHLVHMPARPGPVRLGWQLPWLQWRQRIDLLHMQYRLPLWRTGPCACTIHDVLFETHPQFFTPSFTRQLRWFCRHAARHAALLLTVSRFSQREMARLYGLPPEQILLTPNGVDTQRFHAGPDGAEHVRALGLTPGGYLLTVGRLEPRKNHLTLFEAYARLGPGAPPLAVVGQRDFHFTQALDALQRLGLQDRVHLLERVGDQALPAVLRHAQIFVYPSFAEGFGMPILEAMVSGVPVITSNQTALPEVAGNAAVLVDPHSAEDLARAMQQLIDDPDQRAALGKAGPRQAQTYDWESSAKVLLSGARDFFSSRHIGR
jgi:glycosyltransferase involved in cell wall biosynthesis